MSWSIEVESSTIDDHLGLRVEVGPGLVGELLELVAVWSAMAAFIYPTRPAAKRSYLLAEVLEVLELPG